MLRLKSACRMRRQAMQAGSYPWAIARHSRHSLHYGSMGCRKSGSGLHVWRVQYSSMASLDLLGVVLSTRRRSCRLETSRESVMASVKLAQSAATPTCRLTWSSRQAPSHARMSLPSVEKATLVWRWRFLSCAWVIATYARLSRDVMRDQGDMDARADVNLAERLRCAIENVRLVHAHAHAHAHSLHAHDFVRYC